MPNRFFNDGRQTGFMSNLDDQEKYGGYLLCFMVFVVIFVLSVLAGVMMACARRQNRRDSPPGFYNVPPPSAFKIEEKEEPVMM